MADIEMNGNGDSSEIRAALSSLSEIEKDFADIELKYRTLTPLVLSSRY